MEVLSSMPELEIKLSPLVISAWDLKQEGGVSLCSSLAGNAHVQQLWIFCCSDHIQEWSQNSARIDLGVTNKFELMGKFICTESADMRIDYKQRINTRNKSATELLFFPTELALALGFSVYGI